MADRRDDELESWLSQRIEPLPPPPGTFELIKRRARHRRLAKLGLTAGVAAVIVAAAVTVPQVVNLPVLSPGPTQSPAAGRSTAVTPAPSSSVESKSATLVPSATAPPVSVPVPANFRPASVTFVGWGTGWVIGQAGTPGHCATAYCTSVARTDDAGKTWTGVPAPLAGAPDGATGVSQIRFLNTTDGWAFGPELFATSDGGHTWIRVGTHGQRVVALETVGSRAFAVFASCTGGGTAFATDCTTFTLYSSPAGTTGWTRVGTATTALTGSHGSVSLALTGSRGYLLGPDGTLYAGPVDGTVAWARVSVVPCGTEPQAGALLGAVNSTNLILACTFGTLFDGSQKKLVFSSVDRGASWQQITVAPGQGITSSVAASPVGTVVLGTNQGIDVLPAGSSDWRQATVTDAPAGGFSYVGMTTDEQGVALPAEPASGQVWFTFDGGQSWQPSRVA